MYSRSACMRAQSSDILCIINIYNYITDRERECRLIHPCIYAYMHAAIINFCHLSIYKSSCRSIEVYICTHLYVIHIGAHMHYIALCLISSSSIKNIKRSDGFALSSVDSLVR